MAHSPNSSVQLKKNREYQAGIQLNAIQAFGTNAQVADYFKSLGFVKVTATGTGAKRQVQGIWPKEDQTIEKPAQVLYVIEAVKSLV